VSPNVAGTSFMSRVLLLYLGVLGPKRTYRDRTRLRPAIEAERRKVKAAPPADVARKVAVDERRLAGMPVYTLTPRDGRQGDSTPIVYLHGGCYVFEITPYHYRFCAWLASKLRRPVAVPIYPLAPEHGAAKILPDVEAVVRELGARSLMGDSAGGGMALALAQSLRDEGMPPEELVLLSPWVDVTMSHPDVSAFDAIDPFLSAPGLIEAGRLYAKDLDPKDPRVSPLYGDLGGLGSLSIFIGTRDVFVPDARRLCELATAAGTRTRLVEYASMVHDFMLIPALPEARRACAEIAGVFANQ
jgi:acetyl esterase/lipase